QPTAAYDQRAARTTTKPRPMAASPSAPEPTRRYEEDDDNLLFGEDADDLSLTPEDDDDFLFFDDNDEDDFASPEPDHNDQNPKRSDARSANNDVEFSDSFLTLDSTAAKAHGTIDRSTPTQPRETASGADDSWALDMLEDLAREEKKAQPTRHEHLSLEATEKEEAQFDVTKNRPLQAKPLAPKATAQRVQTPPRPRQTPGGADQSSSADARGNNLHAAFPLHDMDDLAEPEPTKRLRGVALSLTAVALVLVGLGQLFWWERDRLSQQPALHSFYNWACQWSECEFLDTGPNAATIRALSSVLRPLPNGRMRLDAVFVNRGDRPTPFPLLMLTVENALGEKVADGLFAPDEYVGGELRATDTVPPGRPVSVSLNINRPVEDLSSFRLSFHY
ncbi:MAG: DUF3426 domain-containing protein, partial [Natronospirillum sp.]